MYSIITPVKNEISTIKRTITSVLNQTLLPKEWIIVDDSSSDGTEIILNEISKKYDWIKIFRPTNFQVDDYSSRVVYLFNYGFQQIKEKVDFVSKLDADVSFDKNFYKNILQSFEANPKLGIASGHLCINGIPEKIRFSNFVCTRGATKVYRVKCLEDIGGIIPFQGWDTLDNVAARAKGWEVKILPEYFEHLKEEGSRVGSKIFSHYRTGYYNGSIPYFWLYFFIKASSKFFSKPIFLGGLLQIIGYIKARLFSNFRPFPDFIVKQLQYEQKQILFKNKLF